MRSLITAGGLCCSLAAAPAALASDPYRAPEECPDEVSFRAAVGARTDEPIPDDTQIDVQKRDSAFEGTLSVDGRRRVLELETCEALIEALALSLALQLEHEPRADAPRLSPTPIPISLTPPPPPVWVAPPSPLPPADEETSWAIEGGAGLAARWGRGRGVLAEPSVFVGVRRVHGWWSLAVRAAALWNRSDELVTSGAGTARLAIFGGRLELCPLGWAFPDTSAVRGALHPCGSFEMGRIDGEGQLATSGRDASAWFAAGATLRLEARPVPLLGVEATGGLSMPLATYRLQFDAPASTIYQVPRVGAHAGAATFLLWP